jgi:hypothetical protein
VGEPHRTTWHKWDWGVARSETRRRWCGTICNAAVVLVEFHKPVQGRRYHTVFQRRDGLIVELDGGGYNKVGSPAGPVPHDLAHLLVEDQLGLELGLWGVLAAGGEFAHTKVIAGRRAPHADRRARAVVDRAGDGLSQAELVTRAVADLALAGTDSDVAGLQRALGERWRLPDVDPRDLVQACTRLRGAAVEWAALPPGSVLEVMWGRSCEPTLR